MLDNEYMKITNKRITSLAMILVIMVVLVLSITSNKHFKNIPIKSTYEIDKLLKVCYINCNGVKEYSYNSILVDLEAIQQKVKMVAEENRQAELAVEVERARIAEAERKERARLAKVELDKQREIRREEKKLQMKSKIASRSQGYQSNYQTTFYTAKCNGCTGQSASGEWVNKGVTYQGYRIVAAPPSIKFYTKLKITFADGNSMNAIVLDRGSDIQRGRLDILVSSKEEAYRLGRQQVKVEIAN